MSFIIAYFIAQIPFKMFMYRARGGAIVLGSTTDARLLFWALPYSIDGLVFAHLLGFSWGDTFYLWVAFLLAGWLASMVRHSAWQSPSTHNYFSMGLVTTIMLGFMLLPLCFLWSVTFLPLGMTGTISSWLGYKMKSGLKLFGIQWCVPGDSSWEEFFIGGFPFGLAICLIGLTVAGVL